ncbi:MAG: protein-L-isoaspartate O-methyltransferase, partial [Bacteroidia bacterium]|nr:protein-L-isoaspartate O-methyltransferase [Bacteroidia bacterium]
IGNGQTISQPFTVAYQTQLLEIKKDSKVLEIGTGSGYQCAILCQMGAKVFTIERNKELYLQAKERMFQLGYKPQMKFGDGSLGWASHQPYDAILVTAGCPAIPEPLLSQLVVGGKMVIPVGDLSTQVMQLVIRRSTLDFEVQKLEEFRFVPLIGEKGWTL